MARETLEIGAEMETTETKASTQNIRYEYETARRNFAEFMARIEPLGFLSKDEISSQKSYVESAADDPEKMIDIAQSYSREMISQSIAKNYAIYHNHLIKPLDEALESGIISSKSYGEWIAWMRDSSRDSSQKKSSIESALPNYLEERRKLAADRKTLLKDTGLGALSKLGDPALDKKIAQLKDESGFLETLSFSERKSLIAAVTAALPLPLQDAKLFEKFEGELSSAVSAGLISKSSVERWIARFKKPGLSLKAKQYFFDHQWSSYRKAWEKVKEERATVLKNPLFKELTSRDCKELAVFTAEKQFTELHYDKKAALTAEVRAVLKAKETGKQALLKDTRGVLETAASAGYIAKNKTGPWLEHVIAGKRTLTELKKFVGDWAKVRFNFDTVERAMNKGKVPQGLTRLSEEKFLGMSYEQRKSYVEEAQRRLNLEEANTPDTPIKDLKGKVRHALDTQNWEEARLFLGKAWKAVESEDDIRELKSMEGYLESFVSKEKGGADNEKKDEDVKRAYAEITELMGSLPTGLAPLYKSALLRGAGCVQCVTTCIYNRTWCQDRGYLTESSEEKLRNKAVKETENRIKGGGEGHGNGLENNRLDGFGQPAVRDKGIGPQNVFMSSGQAGSFVDEADANKGTWSFWYWTNLIVDGVSADENAHVARSMNWRFKRAARTLEKYGIRWTDSGPPISVN